MGNLEKHLYSPLIEEDEASGWHKETVNYVLNNKTKVEKLIRGIAAGFRKKNLQKADVDDIYEDIVLYLYNSSDYDINKAIDRSSTGSMVSLEGYLNICIKFCVLRSCKTISSHEKETMNILIKDDNDKELDIFNTIADEKVEIDHDYLSYDLETLCQSCEPLRYKFGADLYLVFYIKLLLAETGCSSKYSFADILEALDITKSDLSNFDRFSDDSVVVLMAKLLNITPVQESIKVLSRYIYSRDLINRALLMCEA